LFQSALSTAQIESFYNIAFNSATVDGTILDDVGAAAARTINLHLRNGVGDFPPGALIDTTTSSGVDGSYTLYTPFVGEEHYVVALDDVAGTTYNALIKDLIVP